jgi:uroporphyrinogen-III synthase
MTPHAAATAGPRVLLTRSEEDCAEWAERLARHGADAVALPCIHCEPIATPASKAALAAAVPSTDWLVFTSRRGVEAFAALDPPALPAQCRVAVVGAATAEAAKAELGRVDVVGSGTAAALGATLADLGELILHPRVLLAVAENAGDALERTLEAAGAQCVRLEVYRTVPAPPTEPRRPLSTLRVDNVVLASPSAVTGFVHQVDVDAPVRFYTIGPSTTAAARDAGLPVAAEAREPSFEGILEAMQWRS